MLVQIVGPTMIRAKTILFLGLALMQQGRLPPVVSLHTGLMTSVA
jgi:hypothetical protein